MHIHCILIFKKLFDSVIYVCPSFESCFIPGTRSHPFKVFFTLFPGLLLLLL